jgi:uncharacterized protein
MSADPFLIPITSLRRHPGARRDERRRGPVGPLTVAGSRHPVGAEVEVVVTLEVAVGGIAVTGVVEAPWQGECRRCLKPIGGLVSAEVRELYRPAGHQEDEEETYLLGLDHLDLRPLARDAILLDLPLAPLCRADCAGLCPTCGVDRNEVVCTCEINGGDARWAALDALRPDPH